ncbi:hypothetical protein SAMN05444722_1524 [Rhodovulum sp. ES.010]|uniref:hypothetical protein n=1 Tax=Rhodovulum sp. ES.010 TaxID=1882821 RepID=UPI00092BA78B|nr:hypothetical protein [Rhodovulum sp. ES.010]SIO33879.1 hypothetical protein SAMN05444722_1524 [Rhodovulum sp. ES.010]
MTTRDAARPAHLRRKAPGLAMILAAGLLIAPQETRAGNAEEIAHLRSFLVSDTTTEAAAGRRDFAAALTDYWISVRASVPPLSEEDVRWLEDRAGAVPGDTTAIDPRYARFRVLRRSEVCLQRLASVRAIYDDRAPEPSDEALAWLDVLDCHEDDGDTELYMSAARVSAGDGATLVPSRDIRRFTVQRILRRILEPS